MTPRPHWLRLEMIVDSRSRLSRAPPLHLVLRWDLSPSQVLAPQGGHSAQEQIAVPQRFEYSPD